MGKPPTPPPTSEAAPPTAEAAPRADIAGAVAGSNASLAFDFPFLYPMHTGTGPVLFTEEQVVAESLDMGALNATPRPGVTVAGYGIRSLDVCVLASRQRWVDRDNPDAWTERREYDGQRSRSQLLVMALRDGELYTVTAKSAASSDLLRALTLANRASTRAKAALRLPGLPGTWVWGIRLTAFSATVQRERDSYVSRTVVAEYCVPLGKDLTLSAVSAEQAEQAAALYAAIGAEWRAAWREPEAEEVDEESEAEEVETRSTALRAAAGEAEGVSAEELRQRGAL